MYVLYAQKASVSTYEVPERVAGSSGRLTLWQSLYSLPSQAYRLAVVAVGLA